MALWLTYKIISIRLHVHKAVLVGTWSGFTIHKEGSPLSNRISRSVNTEVDLSQVRDRCRRTCLVVIAPDVEILKRRVGEITRLDQRVETIALEVMPDPIKGGVVRISRY